MGNTAKSATCEQSAKGRVDALDLFEYTPCTMHNTSLPQVQSQGQGRSSVKKMAYCQKNEMNPY